MVSIIVPSVRPKMMSALKDRIARFTKDYELIVISPYSIDGVIHVKEDKTDGVYKAVEKGLKVAKGEYILHIPDDIFPSTGWVDNMIDFVGDRFVIGNYRSCTRESCCSEESYYDMPYSWFPFLSRKTLDRLGGVLMDTYYSSFYGDPDLSIRMWQAGGRVETCHKAWIILVGDLDEAKRISLDRYEAKDKEKFIKRWTPVYGEYRYKRTPYNDMEIPGWLNGILW